MFRFPRVIIHRENQGIWNRHLLHQNGFGEIKLTWRDLCCLAIVLPLLSAEDVLDKFVTYCWGLCQFCETLTPTTLVRNRSQTYFFFLIHSAQDYNRGDRVGGSYIMRHKQWIQNKVAAPTPAVTRGRASFTLGIGPQWACAWLSWSHTLQYEWTEWSDSSIVS